jgi:hypothetical protein
MRAKTDAEKSGFDKLARATAPLVSATVSA